MIAAFLAFVGIALADDPLTCETKFRTIALDVAVKDAAHITIGRKHSPPSCTYKIHAVDTHPKSPIEMVTIRAFKSSCADKLLDSGLHKDLELFYKDKKATINLEKSKTTTPCKNARVFLPEWRKLKDPLERKKPLDDTLKK